ncbi:hypothetical protein TNCV_126641 [Trichonephila clavipes]|nr:hypothetical protein TNCV_126641 [Trichonephila clavipes]
MPVALLTGSFRGKYKEGNGNLRSLLDEAETAEAREEPAEIMDINHNSEVWEVVALSKTAGPGKVETCPDTCNGTYVEPEI